MPSLTNLTPNIDETCKLLYISINPDGSLTRNYPIPFTPPNGDQQRWPVESKDVQLNANHNTSIRVFIPKFVLSSENQNKKLPVIIYFHGGGFILCTPALAPISNFSARMAADLPAIILTVQHRLAPEHRLPAAYDDSLDALLWLKDQALKSHDEAEPWLKDHADFSSCFIMGSSSGGNIAYRLALQASTLNLEPTLKLMGVIMNQPFFGGEERTGSEMRMANDNYVPLVMTDLMWDLCLPIGSNRDHEYSKVNGVEVINRNVFPKCFVWGYEDDPLIDRIRMLAKMLRKVGVIVVSKMNEEGYHGIELFNPAKAEAMVDSIRDFIPIKSGDY